MTVSKGIVAAGPLLVTDSTWVECRRSLTHARIDPVR